MHKRKRGQRILKIFRALIIPVIATGMFIVGTIIAPSVHLLIIQAATTITWDAGGDGTSWSDPLNWDTNIVPNATDEVLIASAATINISAPITIKSLTLGIPAGTVATNLNFAYDAISVGALTINGGDLTVFPGATITHSPASGNTVVARVNIDVQTGSANIYGNINVDSKGYAPGYGPGPGVGGNEGAGGGAHAGLGGDGRSRAGGSVTYGEYNLPDKLGSGGGQPSAGGAGSGGGAIKLTVANTLTINGNITAVGGYGNSNDSYHVGGGGAGGSVWIYTGTLAGSGYIRANGGDARDDDRDGGAGGGGRVAIYYTTNTFPTSQIFANGGKPNGWDWGVQKGGAGTIFMKTPSETYGSLTLDNLTVDWYQTEYFKVKHTPLPDNLNLDNLTIKRYTEFYYASILNVTNTFTVDNYALSDISGTLNTGTLNVTTNAIFNNQSTATVTYSSLNWTSGIVIDNGGTFALLSGGGDLTVPATSTLFSNVPRSYTNVIVNGTLSHSSNGSTEAYKLNHTVSGNFTVNSGGTVNVGGRGYAAGNGPGAGVGGNEGAGGAAHAGLGGNGNSRAGSNIFYGNYLLPENLGSGGGQPSAGGGGAGGGAIKLFVTGTLTVNGAISANGGYGSADDGFHVGGGGAGGSIWLNVGNLTGTSTISANGGDTQDNDRDGGGGGAGRIAIYYITNDIPMSQISAYGGKPNGWDWGAQKGGAGTIFIKAASAANGNLTLNNNQIDWYQTDNYKVRETPLADTITVDNLTITNYSEVYYSGTTTVVNSYLLDQYSYYILSGTLNTNSLSVLNTSQFNLQNTADVTYSSLNWTSGILIDNGGTFALLSGGGDLTIPATSTLFSNVPRSYTNVTVSGTLSHSSNGTTETYKLNYTVSGNMTINSGASVNVGGRGYSASNGPGAGADGNEGAGGAAYAGLGGNGNARAGSNIFYGNYLLPDNLGSGGGQPNAGGAGAGGGAIKLFVTGTLTVDGAINANGGYGSASDGYHVGGGGSGGSIWLNVGTLTGTSTISANGGDTQDNDRDGGGGGAGRIAIYYTTNSLPLSQVTAYGGKPNGGDWGAQKGGAGTIFIKAASAANGNLTLNNNQINWYQTDNYKVRETPLADSFTIDNLTITNYSEIYYGGTVNVIGTTNIDQYSYGIISGTLNTNVLNVINSSVLYNQSTANITYSSLNWTGGILVDNGGTFNVLSAGVDLTIPATSTLYSNVARSYSNVTVNGDLRHSSNGTTEVNKINYTVSGNMTINSGASINVASRGYSASNGPGAGNDGNEGAGGAAHAGLGGNGRTQAGSSISYGDYLMPENLGSGGGQPNSGGAGAGGGAVKLTVNGTLTVNGVINADGGYGSTGDNYHVGGGGSGGSIWLNVGTLTGTSTISANGGATQDDDRDGGGGGGGRIAIYYTTNSIPMSQITAYGGKPNGGDWGTQKGGAGTIFLKATSASYGDLILNNNHTNWYQTDNYKVRETPLSDSMTLNNLSILNYSEVYYSGTNTVNNAFLLDQYSYYILTGSLNTNSLAVTNSSRFYNQSTANVNYSSLNWTSGTLIDNGGVFPLLSGGGDMTIPGTSILETNTPRTYNSLTVNGTLTHSYNSSSEDYKIDLTVNNNAIISTGAVINVNGRGFAMGYGPGVGVSGNNGAGGGAHGGVGGNGQSRAGGTVLYGDPLAPDRLGSGGGSSSYGGNGSGGGAVKIHAKGNLTIDGNIYANGTHSYVDSNHPPGGGAGGSIWLLGNNVSGTGNITANGSNTPNTSYDAGGGGGGRIAIYYVTNTSNFGTLTANGGDALGASAQDGQPGTIHLGGITADPINLKQFKLDGVTAIAQGGSTGESSFIATFQVQDGDPLDTLTPQVEIKPIGTAFDDVQSDVGPNVEYNGSITTATVTVAGLANGESYHWQARVCDTLSNCTNWVSFGSNLETEADIRIVSNSDPNFPIIPTSSFFINGQYTNSLQPTLGFVITDPNSLDNVKYQIQLATDNAYSNIILDYTSAFAAQGTQMFTVGQVAGDGNYAVGDEAMELTTGNYYWRVKAIDDKGGSSDWTLAPGEPAFRIDLSLPTNASNAFMKAYKNALLQYNYNDPPVWFNRNDLYFKWDPGSDAQGVKGYCLYLGLNQNGDPATEKGVLGSSPISTTGTTCQFITDNTEIDFANAAFRGIDWLSSNMERYFFKIKTIDIANNTYSGPDESNYVSFYFDNTPPQNVTAISAASGTFSNTADMYFTWPTMEGQNGSDDHSGLLGFQYSLNSRNAADWIGDSIDPHTGISYSLLTKPQPVYFPESVQDLVQLGQNIIYFRTIDRAGNFSELRTAYIAYGGEAPKFSQGEEVYVIPTQNTINRFAFEWLPAIPSEGNTIASYYYMINTIPPASYSTITSNSATYRPTTETSVAEANISGLRRGANTIHVVAVDTLGNYSPTNYITATFYLNSDLPDPPKNITVADSSIKDASIWRAALVWDVPDYRGTGDLTYHIERSDDGLSWQEISTTTGTAYIDTVSESKRYYWRVATTDTSDQSIAVPSYSNAVSVIPKGSYTVPAKLTSGPAASSITTTTAKITWTTARTSDSKVALGLAPGNYFESEPSVSNHVTEHRISLTNLSPGTTYYYVAKWTDEDGNTGISDEQTFTTEPPPVVKEVRLSNLGISSVMINFTTINASRARIYYGTTASFGGIKEIGTSKLETAYTVELDQLMDGTKYYYKINTFDEEGKEYEGTILDFTTLPRPRVSEVMIQQVVNTAQSTLLVSWQSNTSISSVVTYYPETNPELARDIVDLKLVEGEHKMLIKGLFPQMTYIIRVSGKDVIGNEAVSDQIRITTAADSRAPLLSSMTIESTNVTQVSGMTQTTNSQLIVSWTTDEPSTSQVEFGEGSGTVYNQLTQQDTDLSYNHVVIISGLTPSKVYHLRAISMDAAGNVSKSIDTLTITPKATDNAFDLVITILKDSFGFLTE